MSQILDVLPKLMGEIGAISKDNRNQQQNYSFRSVEQALNVLSPLFVKHGITPAVTAHDSGRLWSTSTAGCSPPIGRRPPMSRRSRTPSPPDRLPAFRATRRALVTKALFRCPGQRSQPPRDSPTVDPGPMQRRLPCDLPADRRCRLPKPRRQTSPGLRVAARNGPPVRCQAPTRLLRPFSPTRRPRGILCGPGRHAAGPSVAT